MSLVNGFGFGWINGLSAPGSIWIWYALVGLLGLVVASIFNAFGLDGWGLAKWVYDARKLLALGIIAWQIFRGDYDRLIRRLTLAFAAVVVLAPMIQSWYVVWLIPLFAVTGIRDDWQVKALYFIAVLWCTRFRTSWKCSPTCRQRISAWRWPWPATPPRSLPCSSPSI